MRDSTFAWQLPEGENPGFEIRNGIKRITVIKPGERPWVVYQDTGLVCAAQTAMLETKVQMGGELVRIIAACPPGVKAEIEANGQTVEQYILLQETSERLAKEMGITIIRVQRPTSTE